MKVSTILATKGNKLVTIAPEQSIREAVALLARHNIGALIVLNKAGAMACKHQMPFFACHKTI